MPTRLGRHFRLFGGVAFLLCVTLLVTLFVPWSDLRTRANGASRPLKPANPYNVVLISLDTVRADHLSCYGYQRRTTPHLDELAEDGLRFRNCAATSNWTLPTHASMFTGLYPESHGARFYSPEEIGSGYEEEQETEGRLPEKCLTLAEILNTAGYRTGAIVANFGYLGHKFQLDQGFEHYDATRGQPPEWYRKADVITDEATRWLHDQQFQSRPFFLCLNYMDPHHPYNPPPSTMSSLAPQYTLQDDLVPREESYFREIMVKTSLERKELPEGGWEWLTARYDGEIAFMDGEIGRLMDYLRSNDLYDETLIIVTADHGEGLGEHNTLGHCFRMHEPVLAVPLLVKLPLNSETGVRDERASHVDILPIVLDVLGIPSPAELPGRSLNQLKAEPARDVFATKHFDQKMATYLPPLNQKQSVLYRGPLKYIEYPAKEPELFDLLNDPQELVNLAKQKPELVRELASAMKRHQRNCPAVSNYEQAINTESSSDSLKALRELGYIQ